ncbi:MAG: thiolase family protein [Desulfobacterales bacterium]
MEHAVGALESGLCNYVLLSYGHSARSGDSMRRMLAEISGDDAVYGHFGATGGYALAARRGMHEFDTGPETWKHIAVDQRAWANLNPRAVMHERTLNHEDYLSASWMIEPFRVYDNCLMTDGGRACIITTVERARDLKHPVVSIMGMGQHNPCSDLPNAEHLAGGTGAKQAGEKAFSMAGIEKQDIDACQIYDCFTYTVEITLQDYGFFGPGEGRDWFSGGTTAPGGRMPVNTSGGQLSEAYHMGLTPLTEGVMQLMGRCGARQLGPETGTKKPETVLCSDNGAILQTHACYILRRI